MSSPHWQSRNAAAGVEDMVLLRQLNDDAIVENLRKRLAARAIFTYIGPVLVSVNPFAEVEKFGEQQMEQYQGAAQYENPPHIFALSDAMFRNVLIDRERQCVIISGESGAGKTVCAKHIMSYLAYSSGGGQRVQRVKETILKSNPLLEAFGNAATTRNWNSSRFGKYVEIVFGSGGEPLGGRISSFLLEKSRVVQTSPGERNFHVFYQMLEGANEEWRQTLGLSTPDYYTYLNCSGCFCAEGTDDRKAFAETLDAMNAAGLDSQAQLQCFAIVAATLHIGNITFVEDSNGDGYATVADEEYLQFPAFLLGLTPDAIKEKLTRRQLQSKWGSTKEQVEVWHNQEQAAYTRDAWTKALYARLFDFLVSAVNKALDVDTRRHSMDLSIGVLDIYGFEVFERNGFEQFCINFVNEKLQQIFVELTLKAEQEEYQSEGIQWTPVEYFNNKVVCDLIESKRPPGVMPILDDICAQIHGQSDGVDEKMLTKLSKQLNGHEHFRQGAGCFVVRHYAGEVVYQVDGFCDRNRDILNVDLVQLMLGSNSQFMCQLFADSVSADPNKKPTSASSKIRSQANHLMDSLMRCVPHYVRCIKPNERKRALDFDEQRVHHQVRYLGLRENIRVRRAGFVYRRPFERFLWRYSIVCTETWPHWRGEPRLGCERICRAAQLADEEFRLGQTKIFIRNPESLFLLEEARERKFDGFARIIQRTFRRFAAKRHLIRQKDEASELLRGLKQRNQHSLERHFMADYIGLEQRPGLQAIVGRRERIYFAATVCKYDRRFRTTRVDLLLTGKCLFLIGRELLTTGVNKGKLVEAVKRQIQFGQLRAVKVSPLQDDFFLVSVTDSYCSLLETPLKTEFLAALNKRFKERTGHVLPLQFLDRFTVTLKPPSSSASNRLPFKSVTNIAIEMFSGSERRVEFRHAPPNGPQTVRVQATPNGRVLVVQVEKGLPPDSRPTGQRRFVTYVGNNNQRAAKTNGAIPSSSPSAAVAPTRPPHQQSASNGIIQQQQQHLANAMVVAMQQKIRTTSNGQTTQQQSHQSQPQVFKPPPLKPKPAVKPRGPLLRALYPYEAQDTDELSFAKDQMIELVKKDESGWWTGRLNGRTGLLPGNYVEEET